MKKICVMCFLSLMLALAACGSSSGGDSGKEASGDKTMDVQNNQSSADNQGTKGSEDKQGQTEPENKDEDKGNEEDKGSPVLGAKGILDKVAEKMSNVKSMQMVMSTEETSNLFGQKMHTKSTSKVELVLDPYMMHMTSTEGKEAFEMYLTGEGYYFYADGQWILTPTTNDENEQKLMPDSEKQYKLYQNFFKSFKVTDNGSEYVLNFDGDQEDFKKLLFGWLDDYSENAKTAAGVALKKFYDNMEASGTYRMTVDKQTFYITSYQIDYKGTFNDMSVDSKQAIKYTNYNKYDKITVPQDVKANAKTFDFGNN